MLECSVLMMRKCCFQICLACIVSCALLLSSSLLAGTAHSTSSDESQSHPPKLNVVLIVDDPDNFFWLNTEKAAIKAAQDLGIKLQTIRIQGNPLRPTRVISALISASQKPDAVVFTNIKNTGKAVLDLLEKHHIPSVIYDNAFSPNDNIGLPGQEYRYWLGTISPDNYIASRTLTLELLNQALKQFGESTPIEMVILEGNRASQTNAQRLLGMYDALSSFPEQVEIKQIFHSRFNPRHAYDATLAALKRYPKTKVVWAANDAMALSAAEAIKDAGLVPGQDILITGFDLLPQVIEKIREGQIYNSYGGHFMAAAWSLVYLYDTLNGASEPYQEFDLPLSSGKYPFKIAIRSSHTTLWVRPEDNFSNINFSFFSRYLNPSLADKPETLYLFESDSAF